MLDSNISTYIDKDGNVQEVGSGGTVDADALIALLSGGNGIAIAKNAAGDKVEAKLAIPETGPISLTNNNTPTPAISIDVTSPYGPPTSSGLVVNNGTNYVKIGGREIGVGSESSSKEIRITDTDVVCMNNANGSYDYFLRQGNIKTINGQSIYGSGDIPLYPVGSIYLSTFSTSPSSLFGGTWEQIKDVGTDETASLVMTEQAISSSSFSFESGAGTVVADEFFVVHNADYSIMQITGRLKVTPSRTSGGTVGVKFNIGSNIIKKTSQRRQCGVYYDGSGCHESVWIQIKTSGDIVIYNNSTYINLPTAEATWSVNAIFFNKSSDGDIMYRWKRIA